MLIGYDRLVPDSYRVVNNLDIVARIPRSSKANCLLQYEHVGKTVMVDDKVGVDTILAPSWCILLVYEPFYCTFYCIYF